MDKEKFLEKHGYTDEDFDGTIEKHLSLPEKHAELIEKLSEEKYGHKQSQSDIITDALELYFKNLDSTTLTLDGEIPEHHNINPDYTVRIDTGELVHLRDEVQIGIEDGRQLDVPDTYKKRLPVITAVLRDKYNGYVDEDRIFKDINAIFYEKTNRTKQRYYSELEELLDPYKRTEVSSTDVAGVWLVDNQESELKRFDDGMIIGDKNTYESYLITEIEWQIHKIESIITCDSPFSKGKSEAIRRLELLYELKEFINKYDKEFEYPQSKKPLSDYIIDKIKEYKDKVNNY